MLKVALLNRVINENCCSVDWGWAFALAISLSPPRGIWQLKCPPTRWEFAIEGKNTSQGEGGMGTAGLDWCITLQEVPHGSNTLPSP